MDKKLFQEEIDLIEVPTLDVLAAIDKGIEKGKDRHEIKSKKSFKKISFIVAAAIFLFLLSGVVFTPVSNVFAKIPILGGFYERYSSPISRQIVNDELMTKVNKSVTDNGITVTALNAYYCEGVIGVTFKATGEALDKFNDKGEFEPQTGYRSFIYDPNDDTKEWVGSSTGFVKFEDGYITSTEIEPRRIITDNFTLPFTFTYIRGVKGTWKFKIPVKKIPSKSFDIKGDSVYENGDYKVEMIWLNRGPATTSVKYKLTFPKDRVNDRIVLTIYDDQGNRLNKFTKEILSNHFKNKSTEIYVFERLQSKIADKAESLIVKPVIYKAERDMKIKMDPITIALK